MPEPRLNKHTRGPECCLPAIDACCQSVTGTAPSLLFTIFSSNSHYKAYIGSYEARYETLYDYCISLFKSKIIHFILQTKESIYDPIGINPEAFNFIMRCYRLISNFTIILFFFPRFGFPPQVCFSSQTKTIWALFKLQRYSDWGCGYDTIGLLW